MSIDEAGWRRAFPRLAEMRDATEAAPTESYFRRIPRAVATSSLAADVYRSVEASLAGLDELTWHDFKHRALSRSLMPREHYGYRNIHAILNEAKGYHHLKQHLSTARKPFDRIDYVPEGDNKSPDWRATAGGIAAGLAEVKTIYESDDQSEYIFENTRRILAGGPATCRRASSAIPDALLRKLIDKVKAARRQLNAIDSDIPIPRVAYLIVYLDHAVGEPEENRHVIATFLDAFNDGMFHVAYELHCT